MSRKRRSEGIREEEYIGIVPEDVNVVERRRNRGAEEVAEDARAATAVAPAAGGRLHLPRPLRPPQLRDAPARATQLHLPLRGE